MLPLPGPLSAMAEECSSLGPRVGGNYVHSPSMIRGLQPPRSPQMAEEAERCPDQPTQPEPALKKETSADSPPEGDDGVRMGTDCGESSDGDDGDSTRCNGEREDEVRPAKTPPCVGVGERSTARICGPSRARCGYCGGKRLHVLRVDDGHNKVVVDTASKTNENGREEGPVQPESEPEVDESNTSKSYGLLFDRLPYETYEEMINRGWRRSGNHLYRPHNFESCCPTISIRLDVQEFASRCNPQSSKVVDSDLARGVLVRGSKSQRKVGKNILRALERYNAKCTNGTSVSRSAKEAVSGQGKSSVLSSDDSVHTSNVAKMQLDDGSGGSSGSDHLEHQHKKTCRRSSDPDSHTQHKEQAPAKSAAVKDSTKDEESLQSLLNKLSNVVYRTITKEAKMAVASNCNEDPGKLVERPKWVWWNDDEDMDVPKWCSFKLSQQKGVKTNGVAVVASASACAAAAGRSRGVVDKSSLVLSVVESLKGRMPDSLQRNEKEEVISRLKSVSYHEKSGHVHVTLDFSPSAIASGMKSAPPPKASMTQKSHPGPNALPPSPNGVDDPIAEYITRYQTIAHKLNNLNDGLVPTRKDPHHQQRFLTVRSVPALESSLQLEVHQLFCRYQTAVHGDFDPFFGEGDAPTERDHSHDYAYYRMKNVPGLLDVDVAYSHLDDARRAKIRSAYFTFYRFLCETPLAHGDASSDSNNSASESGYDVHIPYGTYHQQYRLSTSKDAFDGPLIAVGVVDILPQSLSSVYAFYDPKLSASLEMGKYTALREIEWVRLASQFRPELHYYYLGYYIHSCPKMTYKAEYKPSQLLCPESLKWVDFDAAKKRLEECSPVRHCCALYTEPPSPEKEASEEKPSFTVDDITLDIGGETQHLVQMGMLNPQGREYIDPHVNEFVSEVGLELCQKFIIKLR